MKRVNSYYVVFIKLSCMNDLLCSGYFERSTKCFFCISFFLRRRRTRSGLMGECGRSRCGLMGECGRRRSGLMGECGRRRSSLVG